jgi:hypothetical protein
MAFALTADDLAKQNNLSISDTKALTEIINLFLVDIEFAHLSLHEIKKRKKNQYKKQSESARNMWNNRLGESSLEVIEAFNQYIKLYKDYLKTID